MPTVMDSEFWREKPWGRVVTILQTPDALVELLEIRQGGTSSEHRHHLHWNRFLVQSGRLEIRVPEWDQTISLKPGEVTDIPPGVWHKFRCLEAATVLECYYETQVPKSVEDDIERL